MLFRLLECVFLLVMLMIARTLAEDPVVTIAQGKVRGKIVEQNGTVLSRYYAFEGIPYAAAPVGDKRFKDPKEPETWSGIRNATNPGSVCIQRYLVTGEVEGEEDCLFINIYTSVSPMPSMNKKLPVVVWFHPFLTRSGDMNWLLPNAILEKRVIVASLNYRLGVMGNLNTEDSIIPGNAGLKDALMALRWIQKNIAMFGGDSRKVTVFGDGSGGTIVSYLLLSPKQTKGLIHRAMSMSGSALGPWSYIRQPRKYAVSLWEFFNSSCPNDSELLSCLQSIDAKDLVQNEENALSEEEMANRVWKNPFVPSIEAPGSSDSPFLTTEPEQSMRSGNFLKVPYITGFTTAEGIFYLWIAQLLSNASRWEDIDENFVGTFQWMMPPGLQTQAAVLQMRKFYLGERSLRDASTNTDTIEKFVEMCTDLLVAVSSVTTARLMTENGAEVYVYEFAYKGDSYLKKNLYNASNVPGVAHGEDIFYLFLNAREKSGESQLLTSEMQSVRDRWVQHFTDLAKWGSPTPSLFGVSEWEPYSVKNENYLLVDKIFTMKDHVLGKRIAFWRQLEGAN